MQGYVKMLENEIEQRTKLIELLENGQTFYEVQNDDAMVVANVSVEFSVTSTFSGSFLLSFITCCSCL